MASAFDDWLARGRAHQAEGRPADAIPCYRRAARENPRSPLPQFHLGEALWQLGLAEDACNAWRAASKLDPHFVAPRLALAEVAMVRGEFATARDLTAEVAAIAPDDARARATLLLARAASGDAAAIAELPPDESPSWPLVAVAALAEHGVAASNEVASRRFTPADIEPLRRLALATPGAALRARFADAYCALSAAQPAPPVPLTWPDRTGGRKLRIAWLVPAAGTAGFTDARELVRRVLADLPRDALSVTVLCAGDPATTRADLALPGEGIYVGLPARADAEVARIVAARDCDVLVDVAGLAAASAAMLAARPARAIWSVKTSAPAHREPLVDRAIADERELVQALRELLSVINAHPESVPAADDLAQAWDAAVRLHQQGDLAAAAEGYGRVLGHQPHFAPALHLAGVVAAARNDAAAASASFDAALAAEPGFGQARISAAEHALSQKDHTRALALAEEGLARVPHDAALLALLGRIHLRRRDAVAAEAAFRRLLQLAPADADAHFNHGVALQRIGDVQGAARAYQRALTFRPDLVNADFNLGTLFEQQGNRSAAEAAYGNVIAANPSHVAAYKHLGELLLAAGEIDRWLANFRAFEKNCPNALPLAVYALEACQHAGDFARLEHYVNGLRRDEFRAQDEAELAECLESLLYLLLFFDVEPSMLLRYAQAYDGLAPKVHGSPVTLAAERKPGRLRVGYLSGDLRNHVMGKMMWQAVGHHDRERFELYFYSNSRERDEWTQRFESVAHKFASIHGMDDAAAADAIAGDDIDILVDLSTHTKGGRPGVLAHKPARVQITHVASAGTVGLSQVDFKLTDRYADVPESQEFQIERLLAMEGCVYPYRHVAPAAQHPFRRDALGIAPDDVVIGAFVNPLKLSRRCLTLWRDVLTRLPRARIAFSPANPAMRESYVRIASAGGIERERLIFLPQGRDDAENQARYEIVDFVLDTMPFGGVNGTLEALDMNVPVVTLVGKRHGERTSYSILANLGVMQTVAQTGREYVDIAARLAEDAPFLASVKAAIAAGIAHSPLTDMTAHTRYLEAAYLAALEVVK
jgi:predicted O-linked N-acetylglucosamine transferase (SPINDLY family)